MEAKKILQTDILDIIFINRNKDYGAYELRKNYHKRARNAVIGMLVFTLVAISAPLIAGLIIGKPPVVTLIPKTDTIAFQQIKVDELLKVEDPISVTIPEPTSPSDFIPIEIMIAKDVIDKLSEKDPKPFTPSGDPGPPVTGLPDGPITPGGIGVGPPTIAIVDVVIEPERTFADLEVQQIPEFPGGEEALMSYLSSHIKYPQLAIDNEKEGKVVIGFVVNKDGNINEIKIVKELGYGCDDEAIRVINGMPKWKPGKNNGKPVNVYFNLPIEFQLNP
jgi:protein TonB